MTTNTSSKSTASVSGTKTPSASAAPPALVGPPTRTSLLKRISWYHVSVYMLPILFSFGVVFYNAPVTYHIQPQRIPSQYLSYAPLDGAFKTNQVLEKAVRIGETRFRSPESVIVAPQTGYIYTMDDRSYLYEIRPRDPNEKIDENDILAAAMAAAEDDGSGYKVEKIHSFGQVNGRPLGGMITQANELIYCNVPNGVFKFDLGTKKLTFLTNEIHDENGVAFARIGFCDDLVVTADGSTIYISQPVDYPLHGRVDIKYLTLLSGLEGRPGGRVLKHDVKTNRTSVLVSNMFFPNGIALSKDESFLVMSETYSSKLWKINLKIDSYRQDESEEGVCGLDSSGLRACTGSSNPEMEMIALMPGFPDGVTLAPDGGFWVSIFAPQPNMWPLLAGLPNLRKHLCKLPTSWIPWAAPHGFVVKVDSDLKVTHSLQDPKCKSLCFISKVVEHDGKLFFGTFGQDYIAVLNDLSPP